jgi:hypothetical protein
MQKAFHSKPTQVQRLHQNTKRDHNKVRSYPTSWYNRCVCNKEFDLLAYKEHANKCDRIKESNEAAKSNLLDKSKMK